MVATPDAKTPSSFRDPAGSLIRSKDHILEEAAYILRNPLNGCKKQLVAAGPLAGGESNWSEYLLEAGANEGHISLLALAEISREYLLIEFEAPQDPMFQRIVHGRAALYSHLTPERFEDAARPNWQLVRSKQITGLH